MAPYLLAVLLGTQVLRPVWALQVAPNSKCATVCMDYAGADPSDPNVSNTYGSDIVCNDADYNTTAVGLKFQNCVDCLQTSTATGSGETDQSWFLYNIRFAFDTCMFNSSNATDFVSTPCVLGSVCSPLGPAMQSDMTNPSVEYEYSYCSANGTAFASSSFGTCQQCLRENSNVFYLSNFLTALEAGCAQQPHNGTLIGLNGTLFSNNQVQIVALVTAAALAATTHRKSLTRGAIAGIAIGGVVVLIIAAACVFVCTRKRLNSRRLQRLRSPLDPRFGATNITAPNSGAYSSPQTSPPMHGMYKAPQKSPPLHVDSVQMTRAPVMRNFSFRHQKDNVTNEWRSSNPPGVIPADSQPSYNPNDSGRDSYPTHHAYIPPQYTPPSRSSVSATYTPSSSQQASLPQQRPQPTPAPHPQRCPNVSSSLGSSPSISPSSLALPSPTPAPKAHLEPSRRSRGATLSLGLSIDTSATGILPAPPPNPPPNPPRNSTHYPPPPNPGHQSRSNSRSHSQSSTHTQTQIQTSYPPPPPPRNSTSHPGKTRVQTSSRLSTCTPEEAKRAREKLYREGLGMGMGLGGTMDHGPEEAGASKSPEKRTPGSAVSDELWPGNY